MASQHGFRLAHRLRHLRPDCGRLIYRFNVEAKKAMVLDPLNCMVGCTTCANTCPAHAISFSVLETVTELEALPDRSPRD